jgi:hypothetical protein
MGMSILVFESGQRLLVDEESGNLIQAQYYGLKPDCYGDFSGNWTVSGIVDRYGRLYVWKALKEFQCNPSIKLRYKNGRGRFRLAYRDHGSLMVDNNNNRIIHYYPLDDYALGNLVNENRVHGW